MKKLFLFAVLCVAAAFSSCSKHDNEINHVEPPVPPETTPLAIAFVEGNSLQFDVDETKTVHYTITGGSDGNVVKAEMQNLDDAYTLETTPASATEGTIAITAKTPETENCVIVTVSDGTQTIMAPIDVTVIIRASFDGKTIVVETPGTLSQLLADYDTTKITELTVIGNLNAADISMLNNLPNLAVLDMEHVNLEMLLRDAFRAKELLTSVKLPLTLKTIEEGAFSGCSSLTSVTIPDSVTSIGDAAFSNCSSLSAFYGKFASSDHRCLIVDDRLVAFAPAGLTSYAIPNSVTAIGDSAFYGCSSLTNVTIHNSVTEIGDEAFSYCRSLTSVTIGNSVASIGSNAFGNCYSLKSIYCKAQTPPTIDSAAFHYWSQCMLYVPTGCKEAYAAAEYWKEAKAITEMKF